MNTLRVAAALVLTAFLAGCTSAGQGTLGVHVTDGPGAIDQFRSLTVEVDRILVKHRGDNGTESTTAYEPAQDAFDLVKLVNGNLTTLFSGKVAEGNYTRIELEVSKATGILKADGRTVDVKAPKGSIFVNTRFRVAEGSEVDFLFDVHVVAKGNGEYGLQPNAGGSRTIAKPTGGKVPSS